MGAPIARRARLAWGQKAQQTSAMPSRSWPRFAFAVAAAFAVLGCSSAYYQACDDGRCPTGYLCADPGRADVCTTPCVEDADCDEHGASSFCALGGVCLVRCTADGDCPISSYCDTSAQTCLR